MHAFCTCTAEAKIVITATESVIGDKVLELKKNVDEAITHLDKADANTVKHVIVSTGRDDDDSGVDVGDIHLEKVRYDIHTYHSSYSHTP